MNGIQRTLRGTSVTHIRYDKGEIERHKLEIQRVLDALSMALVPSSPILLILPSSIPTSTLQPVDG